VDTRVENVGKEEQSGIHPPQAVTPVDVETIPGIGETVAQAIIAETGADMSRFPTAAHLAAWAGLAPAIIPAGIPSITFDGLRQALWRSWSRLAVTSGKFRSGLATTTSRSV
jgi:transposase